MRFPDATELPALAAQWLAEQAARPRARVTLRDPRGDVFLDATIEGHRYQAWVHGDGLHLNEKGAYGGCALGVASINQLAGSDWQSGWQLCKYNNQPHLALPLTEAGLRALACTFGLPVEPWLPLELRLRDGAADFFYASGAFTALQHWAAAHPRKIRTLFGDSYLGLWPLSALAGERVAITDANVARARASLPATPRPNAR
jgi:hypothetical protein